MRGLFMIVTAVFVLALGGLALATAQENPAREDPGIEGAEVCGSPVASPDASPEASLMASPVIAPETSASPAASPLASPAALDVCVTPPPGTVPATT